MKSSEKRINELAREIQAQGAANPSQFAELSALAKRVGNNTFMVPKTHQVLHMTLGALKKKLESYRKRGEKIKGAMPFVYSVSEVKHKKHGDAWILYHDVTTLGQLPTTEGWQWAAWLEHKSPKQGGGTIIRRRVEGLLSEHDCEPYREAGPRCEHCGLRRRRNDTYVLRNSNFKPDEYEKADPTTWPVVQVGSSCLEQFLGVSPKAALYAFDLDRVVGKLTSTRS